MPLTQSFELAAAISGSYYLKKVKDDRLRIFVYYLWLTVCVEILGSYGYLFQYDIDYEWFLAIKNSVFGSNIWLFNIYGFLATGLISIFYYNLMTNFKNKVTVLSAWAIYSIFSIAFYTFTDAFFINSLPYQLVIGLSIICLYVILYFLQLINSDEILDYYKLPAFYISVILLLWYLSVIPLFIFYGYFNSIDSDFVRFRSLLLLVINICTYSGFVFAFIYPLSKRKR